jgi:hypothetical protein
LSFAVASLLLVILTLSEIERGKDPPHFAFAFVLEWSGMAQRLFVSIIWWALSIAARVEGTLQNQDGVISVKVSAVYVLDLSDVVVRSHDFH